MTRGLIAFAALASVLFFGGCAIGQKYNYQTGPYPLPISGTGPLQVAVVDQRPYITDGEKDANFVGLQRGGFGNPFDVTTASGRPLAEDVAEGLAQSLKAKGYEVEVVEKPEDASGERVIVLTLLEWKTDIYAQITLHYNLVVQIRNEAGEVVAKKQISGEEPVGGAKMGSGQNSKTATDALATRVGSLFLDPQVAQALK